ncbi:hypothetical protein [uncultured Methanobrevibacter sp.]|uniref:hypothetical protein n=1 Tax=uncultured Methanobrevibacter sp. TaxID=253161 RepID=UPI0025FFCEE6|nr:hypothetical protein [uncultured Methanobrevibacter sp.]
MKIDTHVLFLIVIVGIISVGLVGANVLSSDQSMKQEVFDGIKISVPSDSNFVKTGDGVYKDSKYGVTIHTFKNNDSMINYLKNTKNSKIVPVENQPPQSVAFKKGDTINILVTNGQEGVSVSSKDGGLTTQIANNIVFSDNHKSQKPVPVLNVAPPTMTKEKDFNLIMLLIANVDTKFFNINLFQANLPIIIGHYNEVHMNDIGFVFENPNAPNVDSLNDSASDGIDHSNVDDVIITDNDNATSSAGGKNTTSSGDDLANEVSSKLLNDSSSSNNAPSSSQSSPASSSPASSSPSQPASSGSSSGGAVASPSSSPSSPSSSQSSSSSSNTPKYSYEDCKQLVEQYLVNLKGYEIDNHDQSGDSYVFYIVDSTHNDKSMGVITVDAKTGQIDDSQFNK